MEDQQYRELSLNQIVAYLKARPNDEQAFIRLTDLFLSASLVTISLLTVAHATVPVAIAAILTGTTKNWSVWIQDLRTNFLRKHSTISAASAFEAYHQHQVAQLATIHLATALVLNQKIKKYLADFLPQTTLFRPTSEIQSYIGSIPLSQNYIGFSPDHLAKAKQDLEAYDVKNYSWKLFQAALTTYEHILNPGFLKEIRQEIRKNSITTEIDKIYRILIRRIISLTSNAEFEDYISDYRQQALGQLLTQSIPQNRYFRFQGRAHELTPEIFLRKQIRPYHPYYYRRPYLDDVLEKHIRLADKGLSKAVLISGESLSGKSRAAYEAIKHPDFADWQVFILDVGEIGADFEIPKAPAIPTIAYIDDIDTFISRNGAVRALNRICYRPKTILLATCRWGTEFDSFKQKLEEKDAGSLGWWDFSTKIQPIPPAEIENLVANDTDFPTEELDENWDKSFDQNVGSLFLPLDAMQRRYERLTRNQIPSYGGKLVENREVARTSVYLLRALKAMYFAGNYIEKNQFSYDRTLDLFQKLYQLKFGAIPDLAHLEEAFEILEKTEHDLGFLSQDQRYIYIEEAYLEQVIASPSHGLRHHYSNGAINRELNQLYPTISLKLAAGFFTQQIYYTKLISKADSYQEATQIREEMQQAGFKPDLVTFNSLISKADSYQVATQIREEMQQAGFKPDLVTFNSLISKADSYQVATQIREEMQQAGFKPNLVTFNSLISKADSYQVATQIREEMQQAGFKPNLVTFNSLISKADSYQEATQIREEMQQAGFKPDLVTFNSLISKADSYQEATQIREEMQQAGFNPDLVTFNSLISKADSYQVATQIREEMQQADFKPDLVTFSSLISKADSYQVATQIREEMQQAGFKPDLVTFNSLISKADSYQVATQIREEMQQAGFKPNLVTFSSLISKADSYQVATQIREEMQQAGFKPNLVTFNSLISKADSYQVATQIREEMQQAGFKPNLVTFNSLISKADSYQVATQIREEMQQAGFKPDLVTFNSLISKADSYQVATQIREEMQQAGFKPNLVTFNSLISKADSYQVATQIREEMQQAGFKPDLVTFNSLISKADSYQVATQIREEMQQAGFKPNLVTFNSLISKADSYQVATQIREEMQQAGFKPDLVTFNSLISKADSYQETWELFIELLTNKFIPNYITESSILRNIHKTAQAGKIVLLYESKNIIPPTSIYEWLVRNSQSFEEATSWIEKFESELERHDKKLTSLGMYTAWLKQVEYFHQSQVVIEKMNAHSVLPNQEFITFFLQQSHTHQDQLAVIKYSQEHRITLNSHFFYILGKIQTNAQSAYELTQTYKGHPYLSNFVTGATLSELTLNNILTLFDEIEAPPTLRFSKKPSKAILAKAKSADKAPSIIEAMEVEFELNRCFTLGFLQKVLESDKLS